MMITNVPDVKQLRMQQALIVAGLSGVVAIFLPFTYNVSPLDTIHPSDFRLLRLGLPFFLAAPITFALIRLLASGSISSAETILAYIMGAGAVIALLPVFREEGFDHVFLVYGLALVAGVSFFIAGLRKRWFGQYASVTAMQIAYIVHCSTLLTAYYGDLQAGAYLTLIVAVTYFVQIFLHQSRHRTAQQ